MIISCYPGVGKTSLARKRLDIVDLDSSLFTDKDRKGNWAENYIRIAQALSDQGYIVLVSSHKEVRELLLNRTGIPFGEIFPDEKLYDEWVEKLRVRWETTGNASDCEAYWRVKLNYYSDIHDMWRDFEIRSFGDGMAKMVTDTIRDMNYDLEEVIEAIIFRVNSLEM